MVSLPNAVWRCGSLLSALTVLLLLGCDGGGKPATSTQPAAVQGPPPVVPGVPMEQRQRPPSQPRSRGEVAAEAVPATPAIPATPLVPAKPLPPRSSESVAVTPLGIGDAAPPLSIATWVTGDAVEGFEAGGVTVVEFWATWCGPCLASMPHISELQKQYGDAVRFIGVTREERDVVDAFLAKEQREGATWAEVITYRLVIDESDATNNAYMRAAGQNGIPCAFIVGKTGLVEWIGHPMQIDGPLEAIVNDSYDRATAVAEFAAQQRLESKQQELFSLQREEKWDEALAVVAELQEELGPVPGLMSLKLRLLTAASRSDEASTLRGEMVESNWDEPQLLNELAWTTALGQEVTAADLEIALRAATRAAELTDHADASILDTLARVYYEQGDLDQAISWQEKAVEYADGNASIKDTLEAYRAERDGTGSAEQLLEGGATVEVEVR